MVLGILRDGIFRCCWNIMEGWQDHVRRWLLRRLQVPSTNVDHKEVLNLPGLRIQKYVQEKNCTCNGHLAHTSLNSRMQLGCPGLPILAKVTQGMAGEFTNPPGICVNLRFRRRFMTLHLHELPELLHLGDPDSKNTQLLSEFI